MDLVDLTEEEDDFDELPLSSLPRQSSNVVESKK